MTVGLTTGCFDVLHPFHLMYLYKCRSLCDKLIVLVDSDMLIQFRKGQAPVFNQRDRVYMLDHLITTDVVRVMNDRLDIEHAIRTYKVSRIFKNTATIDNKPLSPYSFGHS